MFSLLFAIISLLYTTVGQAGGTACLALMAFVARPPTEMCPTALALNIVVAAYSTWAFNRSKVIDWIMLRPLLRSSMPTALADGPNGRSFTKPKLVQHLLFSTSNTVQSWRDVACTMSCCIKRELALQSTELPALCISTAICSRIGSKAR